VGTVIVHVAVGLEGDLGLVGLVVHLDVGQLGGRRGRGGLGSGVGGRGARERIGSRGGGGSIGLGDLASVTKTSSYSFFDPLASGAVQVQSSGPPLPPLEPPCPCSRPAWLFQTIRALGKGHHQLVAVSSDVILGFLVQVDGDSDRIALVGVGSSRDVDPWMRPSRPEWRTALRL